MTHSFEVVLSRDKARQVALTDAISSALYSEGVSLRPGGRYRVTVQSLLDGCEATLVIPETGRMLQCEEGPGHLAELHRAEDFSWR